MSFESTQEQVKKIISEQLGVNKENLKENTSFVDDLGADSLDIVELVMAMEEEFNIEIPDEEAEKLKTLKDVFDYVEAKSSAENSTDKSSAEKNTKLNKKENLGEKSEETK